MINTVGTAMNLVHAANAKANMDTKNIEEKIKKSTDANTRTNIVKNSDFNKDREDYLNNQARDAYEQQQAAIESFDPTLTDEYMKADAKLREHTQGRKLTKNSYMNLKHYLGDPDDEFGGLL